MDRYEYKNLIDEVRKLMDLRNRDEALDLLDSENWRKVHNVNALLKAAELYEQLGRLDDAKELLIAAHDRSPIGRMVIYRLALICIRRGEFDEAQEYYEEFVEIAPHDSLQYVIHYQLAKAKGESDQVLIGILEDLKDQDFLEDWALELALLYQKTGQRDKCVELCDEISVWFGEGPYVEKALELKMLYAPLDAEQEKKYRRFQARRHDDLEEIRPDEDSASASAQAPSDTMPLPEIEIPSPKFNTVNLQAEIKKNIQEIMNATQQDEVAQKMDEIKALTGEIPYIAVSGDTKEMATRQRQEDQKAIDQDLKQQFHDYLHEDHDGQISMMVPDTGHTDEQVDGQMSIEDVMSGWEKTRRAAEAALEKADQKKLDSVKAQALTEANEIMDRLTGVLPKLEAGVAPGDLLKEEYLSNASQQLSEVADAAQAGIAQDADYTKATHIMAGVNDMLQREIDRLSHEHVEEPADAGNVPEPEAEAPEQAAEAAEQTASSDTQRMPEEVPLSEDITVDNVISAEEAVASGDIERVVAEGMPEELTEEASEEEPAIAATKVAAPVGDGPIIPDIPENLIGHVAEADEADLQEMAAEAEPEVQPEEAAETEAAEETAETEAAEETAEEPQGESALEDETEESKTAEADQMNSEGTEEPVMAAPKTEEPSAEETVNTPAQEETTQENRAEEPKRDVLEEAFLQQATRATWTTPDDLNAVEAMDAKHVFYNNGAAAYGMAGGEALSLTADEKEHFSYFIPIEGMESMVARALDGVRSALKNGTKTGNLKIIGTEGSGKTMLATSLIEVLQKEIHRPKGPVGKIDGAKLNEKNILDLFDKIRGGALIIERAGGLSRVSTATLDSLLKVDDTGVILILEDDADGMKQVMSLNPGFAARFTNEIRIPIFTIDELVNFGRSYAKDRKAIVDEVGILALYNRINLIQKLDHPTSLAEVRDIVDSAIAKATEGGIRNAFSRLGTKKYDAKGRLILHEKDFEL